MARISSGGMASGSDMGRIRVAGRFGQGPGVGGRGRGRFAPGGREGGASRRILYTRNWGLWQFYVVKGNERADSSGNGGE